MLYNPAEATFPEKIGFLLIYSDLLWSWLVLSFNLSYVISLQNSTNHTTCSKVVLSGNKEYHIIHQSRIILTDILFVFLQFPSIFPLLFPAPTLHRLAVSTVSLFPFFPVFFIKNATLTAPAVNRLLPGADWRKESHNVPHFLETSLWSLLFSLPLWKNKTLNYPAGGASYADPNLSGKEPITWWRLRIADLWDSCVSTWCFHWELPIFLCSLLLSHPMTNLLTQRTT